MAYRCFSIIGVLLVCVCAGVTQGSPAQDSTALMPDNSTVAAIKSELLVRKQVNEVSLVLSVTDKKGHFISGLGAEKFSVFDNDRQQTNITFFQNQTNLPLDIAIVLDTSESVTAEFEAERNSITEFLQQTIRHEDSVVLLAFNDTVRVIAPIRYNWRDLSHRLKRIKPQGETALYDAVSQAAQRLAQNPGPARRVIVLVSDGQENRSQTGLDGAVSAALKAGAVIYSINDGDDPDTPVGKDGETVLRTLSQSTGGNYFYSSENGEIGTAFSKIRKELRSQYVLAYKPSEISSSQFHFLKVVVENLRVRCRRGYYVK
jgi:VWFA-related protein